jgi:LacI family transcriptional regulator
MVNTNPHADKSRRTTLADVAKRIGVSTMSVSRALRDAGHISPKLACRIRAAAKRMGYQPDPALASLVAYRHRLKPRLQHSVIVFVTTDASRTAYQKNIFVVQALQGATERGAELGYRVEPLWLPDLSKRGQDPNAVLLARGIRGLILARQPKVGLDLGLNWDDFSCVSMGYSQQAPAIHFVASHLFQDMMLAVGKARALGYRRPCFVYSEDFDARTLHQMRGAFLFEQTSLLPENRLPPLCTVEKNPREDLRFYLQKYRPDLILSPWPTLIEAVREIGLRPPRDIGYIDFNLESPLSPISGIYQGWPDIGRAAIDRLNMLLQHNERGIPLTPAGTIIFGRWVDGATVRRCDELGMSHPPLKILEAAETGS